MTNKKTIEQDVVEADFKLLEPLPAGHYRARAQRQVDLGWAWEILAPEAYFGRIVCSYNGDSAHPGLIAVLHVDIEAVPERFLSDLQEEKCYRNIVRGWSLRYAA